jgi:hypothetical protein
MTVSSISYGAGFVWERGVTKRGASQPAAGTRANPAIKICSPIPPVTFFNSAYVFCIYTAPVAHRQPAAAPILAVQVAVAIWISAMVSIR